MRCWLFHIYTRDNNILLITCSPLHRWCTHLHRWCNGGVCLQQRLGCGGATGHQPRHKLPCSSHHATRPPCRQLCLDALFALVPSVPNPQTACTHDSIEADKHNAKRQCPVLEDGRLRWEDSVPVLMCPHRQNHAYIHNQKHHHTTTYRLPPTGLSTIFRIAHTKSQMAHKVAKTPPTMPGQ